MTLLHNVPIQGTFLTNLTYRRMSILRISLIVYRKWKRCAQPAINTLNTRDASQGNSSTCLQTPESSIISLIRWTAYQLYLAAGVFSIGETIYYAFSSAFLFVFFVLISVIGLCEFILRRSGKHCHLKKSRVLGPLIAILMGPLSIFVLMIWGGGVHFFYGYQEGYKLLFHF